MKQLGWFLALVVPTIAAAAPPPAHVIPPGTPPLAAVPAAGVQRDLGLLVDGLVADLTKDSTSQARAFKTLIGLGRPAVPYVVAHLGDSRPLPEQSIWVQAVTGRSDTQYHPWYVHDGLLAVLKELTGYARAPMTGHLLPSQRAKSVRKWVAYCVDRYPAQAAVCQRALENTSITADSRDPQVADAK
ncbi:hypothetical protein [Luteibacter aegosomatissinici]|uniref:hypothetical protein n=1 Tax=Luteibacter aegosomatissinici TaxID=2911539 RepID=UPI001FFA1B89|nr:hypothetical protein [Luteibacter aegosomatissinici]UPG93174.1 hypothetical protein L2Y97_15060 [Luteibacter aegosomatissinici]